MPDEPHPSSGDALSERFGLDDAELAANRDGALGPRQRAASKRTLMRFAIAGFVIAILFFEAGVVSRGNGGPVLVPWLVAGGATALAVLFAYAAARNAAIPVRTIAGAVTVELVPFGRGQQPGLLVGGGERVVLPIGRAELDEWRALLDPAQPYRVYVVGGGADGALPDVVAMEPVD